jgi:molybdopterin synthase sulfur carrier subunit
MARVLFFGRLRDVAGASEIHVEGGAERLSALRAKLGLDNENLAQALNAPSVRVALNQKLIISGDDPLVQSGDEIAFMPPVSGG